MFVAQSNLSRANAVVNEKLKNTYNVTWNIDVKYCLSALIVNNNSDGLMAYIFTWQSALIEI